MSRFAFFVICLAVIMHHVTAHPWGAPETACNTMYPLHKRPPQSSPCPFKAHPHKTEIFSNSSLQVTLNLNLNLALGDSAESSSSSGSRESDIDDFKGYMIMAFDVANESVAIGSFITPQGSHTINCHGGKHNAATHSSKSHKSSVKLSWTPPINFEGEVVFKTTFVSSKKYFWLKQVSTPVKVKPTEQEFLKDEHQEHQETLYVEEYDVEIIDTDNSAPGYWTNQLNHYLSLWVLCSLLIVVFSLFVAVNMLIRYRTKKYTTLESQS